MVREKREYREEVKSKKLSEKILEVLDIDEMRELGSAEVDLESVRTKLSLTGAEQEKFDSLAYAEVVTDLESRVTVALFKNIETVDVTLNPDASCYLGHMRE